MTDITITPLNNYVNLKVNKNESIYGGRIMTSFFEKWSKKQKILVGTACVAGVLFIGGVVLADTLSTQQAQAKVEQVAATEAAYKKTIQTLLTESYTDTTMESLSDTFDQKQSDKIIRTLETAPKELEVFELKVKEVQLMHAVTMFQIVTGLDQAFESEGIVKEEAALVDSEKLLKGLKGAKPVFYEKETARATEVTTQLAVMEDAKKSTQEFFTDETKQEVKEESSREAYTVAVAKVEALKQEKLKAELGASLALVDAKLVEKEQVVAVEAEKVAQETAAVEAAVQKEQAAQAQAESGNTNNGDTSSNAGYNGDAGNSTANAGTSNQTSDTNSGNPAAPTQPSNNGMNPGDSWSGNTTGSGVIDHGNGNNEGGNNWESFEW